MAGLKARARVKPLRFYHEVHERHEGKDRLKVKNKDHEFTLIVIC